MGIPLLLFVSAFLPRAIYPVSVPLQWYMRSPTFISAVNDHRWMDTYLQYHPGVTTMWLSGIGMKLFAWKEGLPIEQLLNTDLLAFGVENRAIFAGVVPLAFVIALCIVLIYFVLKRLTNFYIAVAAAFFMALDPFYISQSKSIHVDALVTTFMILSALYLILHIQTVAQRPLILSAVFAGLSFLTKSPSLFLLPYTSLLFATSFLTQMRKQGKLFQMWPEVRSIFLRILVWGGIAVFVFVLVWPRMWVAPFDTLQLIWENAFLKTQQPNPSPTFFNGRITLDDPGLAFYILVIVFSATAVTFVTTIFSFLYAVTDVKRNKMQYKELYWWMFIYGLFFFLQMGLSAKKYNRYILPVFPVWNIMASFGLMQIIALFKKYIRWKPVLRLPTGAFVTVVLLLQAILVYQHHPYYGTHYNQILGGSEQAAEYLVMQWQAEGVDLAGQFLSDLPESEKIQLTMQNREPLVRMAARNFVGQISATNDAPDPNADYRLYDLNFVMRQFGSDAWLEAFAQDSQREPVWISQFDGMTYIWIYANE